MKKSKVRVDGIKKVKDGASSLEQGSITGHNQRSLCPL
jgi:hypothetical protein